MAPSPNQGPPQPQGRQLVVGSILVAAVFALALAATTPMLPMAWDEGNAIWRADGIRHWARRWFSRGDDGRPGPLSREAIAGDWYYTTRVEGRVPEIEGHPAFYGIVIAAGRWISERWFSPLASARLGPMLLFALAGAAMFYRMAREYSPAAGLGTVAALMLLPRMFAHAHFASFDGPLTSCWILAWATFAPARKSWRAAILFGITLGMTLSSKATGWIAPLAFGAWTLLYLDRPGVKALAIGVPVALGTFLLLNPPLWHDPIGGWISFFEMNLDRSRFNISTQFFGRMYNLDYPLPWYNTLVWTGITIPLGILLLIGVGLATVLRRWRDHRAGVLLVANALVLLVVRALPGTPPHDGVRLFLPSFAFLAALAGVGCEAVLALAARLSLAKGSGPRAVGKSDATGSLPASAGEGAGPPARKRSRHLAVVGLLLLYAGSASSLVWYAPQWLSYYSLLIGGLPGAATVGMEPTYYWDALDGKVWDWLEENTRADAEHPQKVRFGAASVENLELMRRWGALPVEFRAQAAGTYRWYVVQHRPSGWQPADRWLVKHAEPAYRKTIRPGGWGPWRLDVPLVEVYPYEDYLRACRATRTRPPD